MKKITFWLISILVVAAILVWGLRPHAAASQSKAVAIGSGVSESPAPAAQAKADSRPAAQTVRLREEETPGLLSEHRKANAAESKRARQAYLHLPLDFEANRGQAPESIAYVAHGPGYALGLSATKTRLSLQRAENEAGLRLRGVSLGMGAQEKRESSELQLRLLGANEDAKATGIGKQPGRSNYFIGNDPTKWRRGIAHYSRVKMTSVYPGVDLVFYGNPQQLEYDFVLAPGADAKAIRWELAGAKKIWVNRAGDAVLRTAAGDVRLQRPVSYQEVEGKRKAVASKFRVAGRELRFELGEYDRSKELVIDPVLVFSLAIGSTDGIGGSSVNSVEVDGSGNIYFVATAGGTDFPSTAGPFDTNHVDPNAIQSTVGIVAKMDPTASTLIYSDFVGGTTGVSSAWYVAPDASGNAFVGGYTNSTDYPLVNNVGKTSTPASCAISPKPAFICPNGFVFKLSADGSNLIFSSLIGGSEVTEVHVLQINPSSGELVVLGFTNSPDIVPAPTTLQKTFAGTRCAPSNGACANTYLLGLDPTTGAVRYQSYIGGAGGTQLASVQIDSSGALYLTGGSKGALSSSLGAVTHTYGPAGGAADGGYDILAMKLSVSAQNALSVDYITVIQGENDDAAMSNVVDGPGSQYFFGSTASSHLPVTAGVFQSTYGATGTGQCPWKGVLAPFEPNACGNAVVGKLSATGTLDFLTYLGGTGPDIGTTMGQDTDGNLWLGGTTSSSNFPFSSDAYLNPTTGGGSPLYTPFLAKMSNDGKTLPYATAVASSQGLVVNITTDNNDNVYVAGFASAVPTTPGVYPENPQTFRPAFLQEWNAAGMSPVLSVTPTFLNFPLTATGAQSAPLTATIQNTGGGPMEIGFQVQNPFTSGPNNFLLTNNCGTSVAANGSCTLQAIYSPTLCLASQGCSQGNGQGQTLLVVTNAPGGPQTLTLTAGTGNGATVAVAPNPIVLPSQAAGTTGANLDVFVSNNGDLPLTVSTVAISGANATDFAFSLVSTGGPACTTPVPSGGSSCQLEVSFKPGASATGTRNAQLVLTDSAIDSPQLIPLSGTVAGTTLNVTPTSFVFNTQAVGGSTTGSFTISNPGTSALQVSSITASGPNASEFSVTNGNCPSAPPFSLAGGASCLIDLGYTAPTGASGLRTATVTIGGPLLTGVPTVALS